MKIKNLQLHNFRGIATLDLEFCNQINVLVGVNGAGKTSILDALAINLSWLVNRISKAGASGRTVKDTDVRLDQPNGAIDIQVKHARRSYQWSLVRSLEREPGDRRSDCDDAGMLASRIHEQYEEGSSLPIIAYYPIDRAVPSRRSFAKREPTFTLDVYKDALDKKENYQSLFNWFLEQDDIANERRGSKDQWASQNHKWIRSQAKRVTDALERALDRVDVKIADIQRPRINNLLDSISILEEPSFFFHQLIKMIHDFGTNDDSQEEWWRIHHDFEFLLLKFSDVYSYPRGVVREDFPVGILHKAFTVLKQVSCQEKFRIFEATLSEMLVFSTLRNLWWLTKSGKGAIRKLFTEEFRLLRSPRVKSTGARFENFAESFQAIVKQEAKRQKLPSGSPEREVKFVRKAIESFVPNCRNLHVAGRPRPRLLVEKEGDILQLDQLSDGEQNLIALVGDIARRLAMANPKRRNPLHGPGVILIDEIDLHLHPNWQRLVIPRLQKVFPKCQFIVSTHSPQIVSQVKPESVFLLQQTREGITCKKTTETYGMTMDRVLELVMNDKARPEEVQTELDKLFIYIERKQLTKAKKIVSSLRKNMPTDPELIQAEMLIQRKEMS
ncbi:MAG: AAA family ATPase [Phycisphaerales bacterium]|jgi:predicted ATP-binding protein involved in virulence|nr:AAA family ATPase [Phycisphaerales bacterium]